MKDFPILEFDGTVSSIIDPTVLIEPIDIPDNAVICFFNDVIEELRVEGKLNLIHNIKTEIGLHPVYELEHLGKKVAVFHPGVGAPLAAGLFEEVIALGSSKFIACGGAGVLDKEIAVGHFVVPTSAVRDEGTSYHYVAPGREIEVNSVGIEAIEKVLTRHKCKYLLSKTWTTDAIYRETQDKVMLRKSDGCLTVEMECSAFCAVAKFRDVLFAQILYGGDLVDCEEWDPRDWNNRTEIRKRLFWFAVEASLEL